MVQVQSLAQELPHAEDVAKKKKKKSEYRVYVLERQATNIFLADKIWYFFLNVSLLKCSVCSIINGFYDT